MEYESEYSVWLLDYLDKLKALVYEYIFTILQWNWRNWLRELHTQIAKFKLLQSYFIKCPIRSRSRPKVVVAECTVPRVVFRPIGRPTSPHDQAFAIV